MSDFTYVPSDDGLIGVTAEQVHAARLTVAEYGDSHALPKEETRRLIEMLTGEAKPIRSPYGDRFMSRH